MSTIPTLNTLNPKAIKNLAKREQKAGQQRFDAAVEKQKAAAKDRFNKMVDRAKNCGSNASDPFHMIAALAHYGRRPVIFGTSLVLNLERRGNERFVGKNSIVVGEIHFSPTGGIAGVRVHDKMGCLLVCEGICEVNAPWSPFVRDFHMLEKDENGAK